MLSPTWGRAGTNTARSTSLGCGSSLRTLTLHICAVRIARVYIFHRGTGGCARGVFLRSILPRLSR